MVYSENIKLAMSIAYAVHLNELDKGGYPYIHHPMHLAEQFNSENEVIVALIHDVLEDGFRKIGLEDLINEFNDEIIEAIIAITRIPGENYFDYILRVKQNRLARAVKIKDLEHNLMVERIDNISNPEKLISLRNRYNKALKILQHNII